LNIHLFVFVVAVIALTAINVSTRGTDGGWWIVWVLYVWIPAWALHIAGVALAHQNEAREADRHRH
jgi:hypothetical protein